MSWLRSSTGIGAPDAPVSSQDSAAGMASRSARSISQPVTISYLYRRRTYRYTPDFMVEWHDVPAIWAERGFAKRCFIECKPHEKLESLEAALTRSEAAIVALAMGPRILVTRRELEVWGRIRHGH